MPFDHKGTIPETPEAKQQLAILEAINRESCGGRCAVGSGGKEVGYLAHGTATDWMYLKGEVPLSFTWEIFGDQKASYEDCFRMFNPLTKDSFEEVVHNWAVAILRLVLHLPEFQQFKLQQNRLQIPETDAGEQQRTSQYTDASTTKREFLNGFKGGMYYVTQEAREQRKQVIGGLLFLGLAFGLFTVYRQNRRWTARARVNGRNNDSNGDLVKLV